MARPMQMPSHPAAARPVCLNTASLQCYSNEHGNSHGPRPVPDVITGDLSRLAR